MNTNLEAALHYAKTFGWYIIPGHESEKRPLIPDWGNTASNDPDQIRAWWSQWPSALVGINVGLSGLILVDIDVHDDEGLVNGYESMSRLAEALGQPGNWLDSVSVVSSTGGGGQHHLFKAPAGVDFSKRKIGWLPGVDVLVGTSYAVLAPSRSSNKRHGSAYSWARDPDHYDVTELPAQLMASLMKNAKDDAQVDNRGAELADLLAQGARTGSRNNDLISLLGWMRRTMGDDPDARARIRAELESWRDRCQPPYRGGNTDEEFERTLESGFGLAHDDRNPHWPILGNQADGGGLTSLSPDGLSEWLEPRVGARLRYHEAEEKMMVWDSRRWGVNDRNDRPLWPQLKAWDIIDQLKDELATQIEGHELQGNTSQANQVRNWQTKAIERRYFSEASLCVAIEPQRVVGRDTLDAHPNILHCMNGVVDLQTGELTPHDPKLMNQSLIPHDYNPLAKSPRLAAQLESMFPGDHEMQEYLQRAVGVSLFGDNRAKALFVLRGEANTGKSTLLQALLPVLGAGTQAPYADAGDKKLFVAPKNDQHPAGLADALQFRLVLMSEEYGEKDKLNMPLLKAITGNDRLKARFMREDFWSGTAKCTPWIATNHDLRVDEFDESVRTRLRIIDVPGVIPEDKRRPNVIGELIEEAEGLLAWAVAGAVEYSRAGMQDPEKVKVAVSEMVDEQDHVLRFLEEACERWEDGWTDDQLRELGATGDDVFHAYERWCMNEGARSKAKVTFIKDLKDRLKFTPTRMRRDGAMVRPYPLNVATDARDQWRP